MENHSYFTIKIYRSIPHITLFCLRVIAFAVILIISASSGIDPTTENYCDAAGNFICLPLLTIFQLYYIILSTFRNNISGIYISILLMLNNAIFSLFMAALSPIGISAGIWIVLSLLSLSFVAEALYTVFLSYSTTIEFITGPLDQSPLSNKIRSAFTTRQLLFALAQPNIYFACLIIGKLYLPPVTTENAVSGFAFGFTILAFLEELAIAINFNKENIIQHRGCAVISALKILLGAATVVWYGLVDISTDYEPRSKSVFFYLLGDALIISTAIFCACIKDEIMIGSGLKEWLERDCKELLILTVPTSN